MKKYIVAAALATLAASPAFAGGPRGGGGGLIGSVLAPITTAVSALNVTALNNVNVLGGGVNVLNGNKTNVSAILPISSRTPASFLVSLVAAVRMAAAATERDCREGTTVPSYPGERDLPSHTLPFNAFHRTPSSQAIRVNCPLLALR
jgi:hypothetical protein